MKVNFCSHLSVRYVVIRAVAAVAASMVASFKGTVVCFATTIGCRGSICSQTDISQLFAASVGFTTEAINVSASISTA